MSLCVKQNLQFQVDPPGATRPRVTKGSERVLERLVNCTVQTTQSSGQLKSNWWAGGLTELLAVAQNVLSQNESRLTWADTLPKSTSSNLRQINNNLPSKSHIDDGHVEPKSDWGPDLKRLIEQASSYWATAGWHSKVLNSLNFNCWLLSFKNVLHGIII